jgi:hypothetical protein
MKQMKITTSSGKMFSAEEVEAQKQALLREVLEKAEDYEKWTGGSQATGKAELVSAVPVEAIQALMEGKSRE